MLKKNGSSWEDCTLKTTEGCSPGLTTLSEFPKKIDPSFLKMTNFTFKVGKCKNPLDIQITLSEENDTYLYVGHELNNRAKLVDKKTASDTAKFNNATCFKLHFGKCNNDSVSFEMSKEKIVIEHSEEAENTFVDDEASIGDDKGDNPKQYEENC